MGSPSLRLGQYFWVQPYPCPKGTRDTEKPRRSAGFFGGALPHLCRTVACLTVRYCGSTSERQDSDLVCADFMPVLMLRPDGRAAGDHRPTATESVHRPGQFVNGGLIADDVLAGFAQRIFLNCDSLCRICFISRLVVRAFDPRHLIGSSAWRWLAPIVESFCLPAPSVPSSPPGCRRTSLSRSGNF